MATTKIWPVRGWLGRLVIYVENPEKTDRAKSVANPDMDGAALQGLEDVIGYAMASNKTVADEGTETMRYFVTGVNCTPGSARDEMLAAKSRHEKEGGIVAFHAYQSFKPGETAPEVAHEIGVKLAERMWGDRFQVVVATHLDRRHLHNHFVINSVSHIDGKRFRSNKATYCQLREASDALCEEYGLSVVNNPQPGKSKHHAEWQAERGGKPTWRSVIKGDIDECVAKARTERGFFANLEALGYEYKVGKDISVRPPGKERYLRLARNFGDEYTKDAICARIWKGSHRHRIMPVPTKRREGFVAPKKLPAFAQGSIVALHRHYLYLLGYYQQRGSPSTNARMHWLLREDIRKLDGFIADTRLLGREGIKTTAQLREFKEGCEGAIDGLVQRRAKLRRGIRAEAGYGESYSLKDNPEHRSITEELGRLRKEVRQCERIQERSRSLLARIKRVERDEDEKLLPGSRKEVGHGRNRTGDRPDAAYHAHGR
jgi:hypothetical protein